MRAPETVFGRNYNPLGLDLLEITVPGDVTVWRLSQLSPAWFSGTTNPSSSVPNTTQINGDLYLNTTTGTIWSLQSGTWTSINVGATPGGSNEDVQYNNGGVFAGSANFTWDNSNKVVNLNSAISATSSIAQNSPTVSFAGNYWTGAASAPDFWSAQVFEYLGAVYTLTSVGNAAGGFTNYVGTFNPAIPVGYTVVVSGFTNSANNGTFVVQDNRGGNLLLINAGGVAETHAATATVSIGSASVLNWSHAGIAASGILIPNVAPSGALNDIGWSNNPGMGFTNLGSSQLQMSPGYGTANIFGTSTIILSVGNITLGANGLASVISGVADPETQYNLTSVANASAGHTAYTGTFSPNTITPGLVVTVSGFLNGGNNVNNAVVVSCNSTTLVLVSSTGVSETHSAVVNINTNCIFIGTGGTNAGGFTASLGLPKIAADPSTASAWGASQAGRIWFNTTVNQIRIWDGVESAGISAIVAKSNLTAQSAAITATTIYAVPSGGAGLYEINWSATVTTVDGSSSTLGGSTGLQAKYTDVNDSVVKTTNPTTATISAGNTTGTSIGGSVVAYCKASTNLQYIFGYTSNTPGQMIYDLNIYVKYLG